MSNQRRHHVAIVIVSFGNPSDVTTCLAALSRAREFPGFDVLICENGGVESFRELRSSLLTPGGPCADNIDREKISKRMASDSERLVDVQCLTLLGRPSRVWIGRATQNLGYAGGVNVWIERLPFLSECQGLWVLNPDAAPAEDALHALVEHAVNANKGMVGSTILPFGDRQIVHCRAGHHWRRLRTKLAIIGRGDRVNAVINLESIEAELDCISGSSIYVTRDCLRRVGPMDERFFLYYEDADWSFRAKKEGLGYASGSLVPHKGGTTIGSAGKRAHRSPLSVYLESRNRINFVRIHLWRFLPWASVMGLLFATEYLVVGSFQNFKAALGGLLAGLKGETGRPSKFFS